MADLADIADAAQQTILDAHIASATSKPLDTSNPSGICWAEECEAETGLDRRFCCIECRDAWQRDNEPRRR